MKSMLVCLSVLLIVFPLAGCGGGGSSSGGNSGGPGSGDHPNDPANDPNKITINGTAHKGVSVIIKDMHGNSFGSTTADAGSGAYSVKIYPFKDPNVALQVFFSDSATPVAVIVNSGQTYTVNEP